MLEQVLLILLVLMSAAILALLWMLAGGVRRSGAKTGEYFRLYNQSAVETQKAIAQQQDALQRTVAQQQDARLKALDENFSRLRQENAQQIENIRKTVDEKLQDTLETKLTQSFGLVNERLEQVYKGLGEMQTIASNVGDLKKILSNVKTRGILGEVQLGGILEQILSPEQYEENVATRPGSSERVEFAVKLPGSGAGETVYLPIDAKFPGDTYSALQEAYDTGDKTEIELARKRLLTRIASEGKDICDKYIAVPYTTDFAVMFLPFEGLYAEVVRNGMIEMLQRKYRVTIAGPTTMAALLNSLQMGFNTLAIEKRSNEVWKLLASVRAEFDTFADVLQSTQHRLNQANADLDRLVGVRTRQIQRKLRNVSEMGSETEQNNLDE
ncbi:MAG: DNA recombination protein RmuC [Clostridia bacterium]|nr:DNA recombination protein RmuC [Clostridia bacterium]